MSNSLLTRTAAAASPSAGAPVIARIRRLVIAALVAGFGYAALTQASSSYCPGGFDSDGNYVDWAGNATDVVPSCVNLALRPSPFVLIAIAAIVVWALGAVIRRATDETAALRLIDRAALAVIIVAAASLFISQVWFGLLPVTSWDGTGTFVYPFPFGSVEMTTSEMVR